MANVAPDDIILVTWQSQNPPAVQIVQAGDPKLPTEAALSGVIFITFPNLSRG